MSSSVNDVDRPGRSRNAKAQARHRAKRKAYIEQLEQTVTKLQAALGYSPEQVSALPPSSVTIRELQQDNNRLQREIEELRRALAELSGGRRGSSLAPYPDPRACDRVEYRRRKSHLADGVYMNPGDPPHPSERPPPLTIPQPLSHQYGHLPSTNGSHNNNSSSMFNLHGPAFQMPNTPSGSSATSSPPFSPIQMQHHSGQYPNSVKVEEDSYVQNTSSMYSYSNPSHDSGLDWHSYSSERAHPNLHR